MSQTKPGKSREPHPRRHAEGDEEELRDDAVIGVAVRYSLIVLVAVAGIAGSAFAIWRLSGREATTAVSRPVELPTMRDEIERPLPAIPWTDITERSGIRFRHENGARGEKLLPETMGGGCAFFDHNGDGAPDILFINSKPWDHDLAESATGDREAPPPGLVLYENDGRGQFRDVTAEVGLDVVIYGQGCAIGDFDNDGRPDIFVTGVWEPDVAAGASGDGAPETGQRAASGLGPHRLFRNLGGRFVDVTAEAGVSGEPGDWGSACGWFDMDGDGDLDLWVCHYLEWSPQFDRDQKFRLASGDRAYGRPQAFGGAYPRLYRNDGNGAFTEVSLEAGLRIDAATTGTPLAKSLGLVFHDFDRDGLLDVMVANDTVQNQLFRNLGDGRFQELATLAGVAFDSRGNARGAMGIDVAAAREETDCACVVIGNFANEMSAFYVSDPGSWTFSDQAIANGLGPSTRLFLTFGVCFFDADLDGWDDILHANGHLEEDIAKVQASQSYEQSPQLFWNAGPDSMTEFAPLPVGSLGDDFVRPMVGRGAAYADIDGDGDLDVLITASGGRPRLLRNDQQTGNGWLRVRLEGNGTTSNRDAVGGRVEVALTSGRVISKTVNRTRSYLSQVELPLTFGLGDERVASLRVVWPDGEIEALDVPETTAESMVIRQGDR